MTKRHYSVTYVTVDGKTKMETIAGRNHLSVERRISAEGGHVTGIYPEEDEYVKSHSWRRTVIGLILVIAIAAICVGVYWHRVVK